MFKAGRAGSIPDGITTSQPFQNLLHDVGRAVDSLNSIVVGLDAVENDYPKPVSLDISWNPTDRRLAARLARKFVLEAVLVRVAEANKSYFNALGKLSQFKETFEGSDKAAAKMSKIATAAVGKDYHSVIPAFIYHWRNRIVHLSDAKPNSSEKSLLQSNEDEIHKRYKSLSVTCLLCHFEEARPTLKDVSSLIAMSINLAREIDKIIHTELGKEDLDALLDHYGLRERIRAISGGTKPEKYQASIERLFKARAPLLLSAFRAAYPVTETVGDSFS